jgi:tRNA 2-thiouridine synthesizing protein A
MSDPSGILGQAELDLRGVMCPYNYVKTKLKLETMQPGQILSVILDEGEPMRNVPRSVLDDGHMIVKQEKIGHAYRVLIKKQN